MNKDRTREKVRNILLELGYLVEIIPEDNREKRADLKITKENETFIIEVKSRIENEHILTEVHKKKSLEVTHQINPLSKSNALSKVAESAESQLNATPKQDNAFLGLWFSTDAMTGSPDADQQMKATLLGTRHVFTKTETLPVYFAAPSDFYRYKNIHFTVIDKDGCGQIIINPFSNRYNDFKKSVLYIDFSKAQAILDPYEEEKSGNAFVVNGEVDRNDDQEILEFLRNRYGKEFIAMVDLKSISGFTKI